MSYTLRDFLFDANAIEIDHERRETMTVMNKPDDLKLMCVGMEHEGGRAPEDDPTYRSMAEAEDITPSEWVWREEGTLNTENGHYLCDGCYIKAGQPSRPFPERWVCP